MIDASTAVSPLRLMTPIESEAYELGVAPLSCVWEDDEGWHAVDAKGVVVDGASQDEAIRALEGVSSLH